MRIIYWKVLVLLLTIALFVMMAASLAMNNWSSQGEGDTFEWEASLFVIKQSSFPTITERSTFVELAEDFCELDENSELCHMFEDLRDTGAIYTCFETISCVLVFAWTLVIFVNLTNKKDCKPFYMAFFCPSVALFSHILAISLWALINRANYSECDDLTTGLDRESVCAT
jgi:hypothetical protein